VTPPRSPSARRVLSLWSDAPLADRVQANLRWWSAPFAALEQEVPLSGDVLVVGCGRGLLATYLALASRARRVVGVDVDEAKVAVARRAASGLDAGEADVSFGMVGPGAIPTTEDGWRGIVVAEVLHLLAPGQRRDLLARCAEALAPGGLLVVEEVDTRSALTARTTRLRRVLATQVVGAVEGDTFDPPTLDELQSVLGTLGLATQAKAIDRSLVRRHAVVLGTRPAGPDGD
jgi:2-polyprenyl-3-methyl-5-hydroxy-6-metoxy-1,4-benzoquinol methylase